MANLLTIGVDDTGGQEMVFEPGVDSIANSPVILASVGGIDGTAAGTTDLYTVPTGRTAIIITAIVRLTAVSGLSIVGTMGIGITAGEDDIYASQIVTGLNATNRHFQFTALGTKRNGESSDVIKLGIDTGFTATTATLSVDLIGYLV